jgi:hypothetical protein
MTYQPFEQRPTVRIRLDSIGRGEVSVDGVEIPAVQSVAVHTRAGEATRVYLKIIAPNVELDLGNVEVEREHVGS